MHQTYVHPFYKGNPPQLKSYIVSSTVILDDFRTSFLSMERLCRHKVGKQIPELNNLLNASNRHRQSIPLKHFKTKVSKKTNNDSFSLSTHVTFSAIDYKLEHQAILSKDRNTEITPSILSDFKELRSGISNYRNGRKHTKL